jgi:hypothetical protein
MPNSGLDTVSASLLTAQRGQGGAVYLRITLSVFDTQSIKMKYHLGLRQRAKPAADLPAFLAGDLEHFTLNTFKGRRSRTSQHRL